MVEQFGIRGRVGQQGSVQRKTYFILLIVILLLLVPFNYLQHGLQR